MDIFTVRVRFSDGDTSIYEIKRFGPCEAMQSILSFVAENSDKALELESVEIEGFRPAN